MEGKEVTTNQPTNHGLSAHLFTPRGRLETSLTSGLAWYRQIFTGQGGGDGTAAYTARARLSVLVLALCSSTRLLCMTGVHETRGADYRQPASLPTQVFSWNDGHHSLRISPHGGDVDKHAPLRSPCSPPPRRGLVHSERGPVLFSGGGHTSASAKGPSNPPCPSSLPAIPWHLPPPAPRSRLAEQA